MRIAPMTPVSNTILVAVSTILAGAMPVLIPAQDASYDPELDVMIPNASAQQPLSTNTSSRLNERDYLYDPTLDVISPRVTSPQSSNAAAVQDLGAGDSYYDPVLDVMVPRNSLPQSPYEGQSAIIDAPVSSTFQVSIHNGQTVSGPQEISVAHDAKVKLFLDSAYDTVVSLDDYQLRVSLRANQPVVLSFTAQRPGRFALRDSASNQIIGVIEVGPPTAASTN